MSSNVGSQLSFRVDFPATIPFWVKTVGLPVHYCLELPVKSIGEALGELVAWEITIPEPRVQVVFDCDLPLIFQRDIESDTGDLITVTFEYAKLQRYCKRCFCLSHDSKLCPDRVVTQQNHIEQYRRHEEDDDRRRKRSITAEAQDLIRHRQSRDERIASDSKMGTASTSSKKPARQELLSKTGED